MWAGFSNVIGATGVPNVDGLVIPAGAQVTLDIVSVGTTATGQGLTVTVQC